MKNPCPLAENGKHKYSYLGDKTLVKQTLKTTQYSRVGVYKCDCGHLRQGGSTTGL